MKKQALNQMHAAVITDIGGMDTIQYLDVFRPKAKIREALIKVSYCGVNHLDTLIRQGKRPGPTTFPHVLGSEITGEIVTIPKKEKSFHSGDKVVVYPWTFDGTCQACLSGQENICDHMGTIGRTGWGGYAEYVSVPIKNLIKLPKNVSEKDVCAITLTGTTAVHLITRGKITDKSRVLVTGATGGVGTLVMQILKKKRCTIITATSHPRKKLFLKKFGAKYIVSAKHLMADVRKLFPQGVDFVIDIMGGNVWSQGVESLAKNGTIVFCATSLEELGTVNIGTAFSKQINILGSYGGSREDLKTAIELLQNGVINPVIDTVFPLKDVKKAHQKIDTSRVFGKILLQP